MVFKKDNTPDIGNEAHVASNFVFLISDFIPSIFDLSLRTSYLVFTSYFVFSTSDFVLNLKPPTLNLKLKSTSYFKSLINVILFQY